MESKFEKWLLKNGWRRDDTIHAYLYYSPDNTNCVCFKLGNLLFPLPTIKEGHKIKTDNETIQKAINKYSYESVIESMFNPKVILTL